MVEKVLGLVGTSESFQTRTSGVRKDARAFQSGVLYCVKARGRNRVHKKKKDEYVKKVPRITMDSFIISEEDSNANKNPIVVMIDENSGDGYARATGQKRRVQQSRNGLTSQRHERRTESVETSWRW